MSTAQDRVNKRSSITMQQRIEILQKLEEGASMIQVATSYGICTKSVQRIKRNAVEVRQLKKQETNLERKRRRTINCKDLDERLYTWYLEQRALGHTITDLILRERALRFVGELGGPSTFTASKGWVWRFKNRYRIRLLGVHSEKSDANRSTVEKITRDVDRRLKEENDGDYICDMAETERVWQDLSRRKPVHVDEKRIDGKEAKKDHATDEFSASSTDSYKLPNLFFHKNPSPLPVILRSDRHTWMDEKILADWYNNYFTKFLRKSQLRSNATNKLLPLDNNKGYISPKANVQDDHFETLFLPTDTTSILQPSDQGSIETNKICHYNMLKCVFNFLREIHNFYKCHNSKNYLNTLYTSWANITLANIKKSCRRQTSDSEECASSVTSANLQELIYNITGENIASNELIEWLTSRMEAKEKERQEQEDTKDSKENIESNPSHPDDKDIEKAFGIISAWANTQNNFVKFHAKTLKNFYDQQR